MVLRLGWLLAAVPFIVLAMPAADRKPKPTFENDIKPILKARCESCHSGTRIRAGLDVTKFASVTARLRKGDPVHSLLIQRLKGAEGKPVMPLGFKPLDAAEIALISKWIQLGAVHGVAKPHWAYLPVKKVTPPILSKFKSKHPIDAFIELRRRAAGLASAPEAKPETLLRRVTLDLTGLPPTLEELDRYVTGWETYDQALDRLLTSPHYGERMASSWLDLARYADTNGYEKDGTRTAWKYRDWVVEALNRNEPYDKFTVEQLAGDLLPNPTMEQKIATGFNRNTMLNLEGGVDQEEAIHEVRNDRVATTSLVWLGQTLACARCHDHKYDPLSQKDYYRFYGFFANNKFEPRGDKSISEQKYIEPSIPVTTATQFAQLQEIEAREKRAKDKLAALRSAVAQEQQEWEVVAKTNVWQPVPVAIVSGGLRTEGREVYAIGLGPETETYELKLTVPAGTRGLRLEALPDPTRYQNGPGRATSGNFILSRVEVSGATVANVGADYVQEGYSKEGVLDNDPETGWAINGRAGKRNNLAIELDRAIEGDVVVKLEFGSKQWVNHTLGHFAFSATASKGASRFAMPEEIEALVRKDLRTPRESKQIGLWFEGVAAANREIRAVLAKAKQEHEILVAPLPTAMVMEEADRKLEAPIRHRGEFMSPGKVVPSGTPASLGAIATGNRLALAKWMVNPKNPLTARVQVNRLWEMLFGRGLVETSENFGTQGSKPSHPELLDWLAATYVESGWDTKRMLRLIMSSQTYRQSSTASAEKRKKDPTNIWLARGPRVRLPAEAIRDIALASSGLLDPKLGGAPVYPYQPDGVWDSPYSGERWMPSKGGDRYRRALYTFWKRTAPFPSFVTFDATSRETCTVRRSRTNTPLQALAQLNDPGLFEAAKALGARFKSAPGPEEARLAAAFRAVTSRQPTPSEVTPLVRLLNKTRSTKGDAMAWSLVGNVLLNLDEAITKE